MYCVHVDVLFPAVIAPSLALSLALCLALSLPLLCIASVAISFMSFTARVKLLENHTVL